jgi:hypothetical protein
VKTIRHFALTSAALKDRPTRLGAILAGRLKTSALDISLAAAGLEHGVGPLLYRAAVDRGEWADVDAGVRAILVRSAREAILTESVRHAHLERLAAALSAEAIEPLVFKGSALAHSHYVEPWLRPRGDTDLLVQPAEVKRAEAVLRSLGLQKLARPDGRLVTYQARYTTKAQPVEIAYDLHWRIADPHVLAEVLPHAELLADSAPGPVPGTRRLGDVHALVAACVHRAAHHHDTDNVLLLHDLALVARRLSRSSWERFATLVETRRLRAVCRRGLALAEELFGASLPGDVSERLNVGSTEPSAIFVSGAVSRFDLLRSDLRALPTWRDRLALLYGHALPSSAYLLCRPDLHVRRPAAFAVPWLYTRRIIRGLSAWRAPL